MAVIAFLVYHTRVGRTRFVDQLYVAPRHRRKGHAAALLAELARGPIELVVRRDNGAAIAAYLKLGFCLGTVPSNGGYAIDDAEELFMRTTSYRRAATLLGTALRRYRPPATETTTYTSWNEVPASVQNYMVHAVATSERLPEAEAREVVHPSTGPSPRYLVRHH